MWLSEWQSQCGLNVKTSLPQRAQHHPAEQLQSVSCEKKVKECSEVHTLTRFRLTGLPTSCIDFKRALQWFIWHLYKGPQSTEGPHRQGLQRSSELYLHCETKTRETDSYWVIATHFLCLTDSSRLSFLPCRSDLCLVPTNPSRETEPRVPFWDTHT